MQAFHIIFTLVMLLAPAVFTLFYRPRAGDDVDHERIRALQRALWSWTWAAVGLYAAFACARVFGGSGWADFWDDAPWWLMLRQQPDRLVWLLFFPLWFGLSMRLLVLCRPEASSPFPASPAPASTQRSASLASRTSKSPIPWPWWLVGWAAVSVATVLVLRSGHAEGSYSTAIVALELVMALAMLTGTPYLMRSILTEPEPMDAAGSDELARAYAAHRRKKAWGFYGLTIAMVTLLSSFAVLQAWGDGSDELLGLLGGALGSTIGVGGAAFGVAMSNERMRIRRLLDGVKDG